MSNDSQIDAQAQETAHKVRMAVRLERELCARDVCPYCEEHAESREHPHYGHHFKGFHRMMYGPNTGVMVPCAAARIWERDEREREASYR